MYIWYRLTFGFILFVQIFETVSKENLWNGIVPWNGGDVSWDNGILGLGMGIWEIEKKRRQDTFWRLNDRLEIAHLIGSDILKKKNNSASPDPNCTGVKSYISKADMSKISTDLLDCSWEPTAFLHILLFTSWLLTL